MFHVQYSGYYCGRSNLNIHIYIYYLRFYTPRRPLGLTGVEDHPFILSAPDILQCLVEVFAACLNASTFLLVTRQVGMDQFNEAIHILRSYLDAG